ncbi:5-methylaminomethyl-2-thiouridylate methyltransferase [Geranomyces variabilis]|nr:5-methylaminomethyl-2-thiouridylate methyltransferase [Geranomyces variabilis]KAJ3132031.1 hypothetical protein HDU90_007582 [Geranomyces variabilis]
MLFLPRCRVRLQPTPRPSYLRRRRPPESFASHTRTLHRFHHNPSAKHVVLGMSGGIDSSVAAHLLLQQNYRVTGIYMQNWDSRDEDGSCPSADDWTDVQRVCARLSIPCFKVGYQREYWVGVFDGFLEAYAGGRTPNPDVDCNRVVKFGRFFDQFIKPAGETTTVPPVNYVSAAALDGVQAVFGTADYIATGHYARTDGDSLLRTPADPTKDQTYYLSTITSKALSRTLFPLGGLRKARVKEIAREIALPVSVATKAESMGICFVGKRPFKAFLGDYIAPQFGVMRSVDDGAIMGVHDGVWNFTVGQRARLGGADIKWYVCGTDVPSGTVYIAPGRDHPALYRKSLTVSSMHWISGIEPAALSEKGQMQLLAKYRYRTGAVSATLMKLHSRGPGYDLIFDTPQHSVAVGQHVALYAADGDVCFGGGTIDSAQPNWPATPTLVASKAT